MKIQKNIIFSLTRQRGFSLVLFFLLAGGMFLASGNVVQAAFEWSDLITTPLGWVGSGLEWAFQKLLLGVLGVLGWFVGLAVVIFSFVLDPSILYNVLNNQAIYELWKMSRDVLNLFFILVLLFTAFATIFQVEKFNYKKTLITLVIMALLVNFSFPISRFIIDTANVPMYFFIQSATDASARSGSDILGSEILGKLLSVSSLQGILVPDSNSASIPSLLAAIVFMFLFMVSLMTLAMLFMIRLVALILLVIFSPVGFVGNIFEPMKKYSGMWWDKLFQYAFFGPIAMFMLLISIKIMVVMQASQITNTAHQIAIGTTSGGGPADWVTSALLLVIPLILIWFTIGLGQSMSIAGAGSVIGGAQKFSKWAGNLPWRGIKAGGRTTDRWLAKKSQEGGKYSALKYLSPTVVKEAWKQYRSETDRRAFEPSTGTARDSISRAMSGLTQPIKSAKAIGLGDWTHVEKGDYGFAALQGLKSKYTKEISDVSGESEYVMQQLDNAIATKNGAKAQAALEILAKHNDINELMKNKELGHKYGYTAEMSSENSKKTIEKLLGDAGVSDSQTRAKQMINIGEIGLQNGNFGIGGMAKYDDKKLNADGSVNKDYGTFRTTKEGEQAEYVGAKITNVDSQQLQKTLHHNTFFIEGPDGQKGDLNGEVGKAALKAMNEKHVKQSERARGDLLSNATERLEDPNYAANFPKLKAFLEAQGNENAERYIRELQKNFNNPPSANP